MNASITESTSIRRVAIASFIGTTIEWYDFFLYGTASALIFGRLFFPNYDPLTGALASFGTYAVGFAARPIGGIVCGHFGDRIGRKSMLVFTLMVMGVATFCIGLLPTYEQIGPWAAVALIVLRLAQGFGVGGEWGGAVLMAVEHAPPGSRDEADGKGPERRQRANQRVYGRKEQAVEDECGRGAVEKEVVPLDRRADEAGDRDEPNRLRSGTGGRH